MKSNRIVDKLLETTWHGGKRSTWGDAHNLGKWWGPEMSAEQEQAEFDQRQARREQQAEMQRVANTVSKMEPNSKALLDLVIGRDNLLKERKARIELESELKKLGLRVADVEDYIFKERGTKEQRFGGVEPGALIGVKARGQSFYFSKPLGGLPAHVAQP